MKLENRNRLLVVCRELVIRKLAFTTWRFVASTAAILASTLFVPAYAQVAKQYPPLSEYLMAQDAEIALARSAAPANISSKATIKVLTKSGYDVIQQGDNRFVCM